MNILPPTINDIKTAEKLLSSYINKTPIWRRPYKDGGEIIYKLELLQRSGTFKARGALMSILSLSDEKRAKGVVAASAGNHAAAVSYAAKVCGVKSTVCIPKTADAARVGICRKHGSNIIFTEDMVEALSRAKELEEQQGLYFIHPFEGPKIALGTATIGLELFEQAPDCDAVVVPVGGGGLLAGISSAIKQLSPNCEVYGVEPEGADTMYRGFQSGNLEKLDAVRTIADSLGTPYTLDYSFSLCKQHTDQIVLVSDAAIKAAIYFLFREIKIAVEPAGAAATAGLLGPLSSKLKGKKVALIVCGSNIAPEKYANYLIEGEKLFKS